MSHLLDLTGKVALITGSTRGIGWASAQLLAEHGANVIINGSSNQTLINERVQNLEDTYGSDSLGILCDARQPEEIRQAYQLIFKKYKRLDILINNAGILDDALVGMVSDDMITRTYETNTFGAIHHLQSATRLMQRKKQGSIINMTSIIGTNGNEGQIVYGSSKAALIGLTLSASKELAPQGIRVNAIAPGFIDTDMARDLPQDKFLERTASIKMARLGQPEDIARAALFLSSDLSSYITGQVLGVDGGMLI